jgi:hypothetical protein
MTKTLSLLTFLAAASSQAATINWANGGGRGNMFVLSDGVTRVAAGSLVEVGFYETATDATSTFVLFGTTTMGDPGTGVNAIGGHIPATGKGITSTASDGNSTYTNKQFSIRVYNAASASAATQMGVFTSATWTSPQEFNDSSDSWLVTVGIASGTNTVAATALDPAGPIPAGSYRVGNVTVGTGTNAVGSIYTLAAVPEPTSFALSGMALFGLLAGRRRK